MASQEEKIKQVQKELKLFTDTLAKYEVQFNADGNLDVREKMQLKRMKRKIARITKRSNKLLGIKPTPTPSGGKETSEIPISVDPKALVGDRGMFVYKDVTKQHLNKITELYKTGEIGSVDEKSDVHWNDVTQGGVGDCYFLSAIGAVAKANPALLKKLIKGPFKDGSYEVTLHIKKKKFFSFRRKRKPHKVRVSSKFLVDANGKPIYTGSGDAELWVMLLEKAYALLRGEEQTDMKHHGKNYDVLEAGWGEEGIEVLTGKEASMLWVPNMSIKEIKTQLSTALAEKRPITTGTIEGPAQNVKANETQLAFIKANLVFLHEYFVLDFDGSNITIQNPWNDEMVDGDGRGDVTISIKNYKRWFRDLCIQDK